MLTSFRLFPSRKQHGFSMIELLVTILIFAIGFLGIASMQGIGMRMTHDAELMGQANLLVNSLADRLQGQGSLLGVSQWKQRVEDVLPQGVGDVKQANHIYTISVDWLESQDSTHRSGGHQQGRQHYELSVFL